MDHKEHVYDHRTAATRGVVQAVNDNGCAQTVDVLTHDGVLRASAEVHEPFGFSSVPPANGAVSVLVANGADHSDMIALPAAVPLCRFGGKLPGETVMYGADGTRVYIRQGGIVQILAASQVIITVPEVTVTASAGMTLTGDISITGTLSVTGAVSLDGNVSVGGDLNVAGNIVAGGTITGA